MKQLFLSTTGNTIRILKICLYVKFKVVVVDVTIMQQASTQWREQQNGRLTGSIFHDDYTVKNMV